MLAAFDFMGRFSTRFGIFAQLRRSYTVPATADRSFAAEANRSSEFNLQVASIEVRQTEA